MSDRPVLKRGAQGAAVRRLQRALTAAGFAVGVDGEFGPNTERAVRSFQRARGLGVDGTVGPATWSALAPVRTTAGPRPARSRTAAAGGGAATATRAGTRTTAPRTTAPRTAARRTAGAATGLALSDAGAAFIGRFEGFRGTLYNDPVGHCTIGFGHLVHHGNCNGSEPAELRAGITRERGLELLKSDAAVAAGAIAGSVTVPLNQQQFDALVSFVFNVGTGAFRRSTLLRELNSGDHDAVPAQLMRWVKASGQVLPGLVRRREAEGKLFRDGAYE